MYRYILPLAILFFLSCDDDDDFGPGCPPVQPPCDTAFNFLIPFDTCYEFPPSPPLGYWFEGPDWQFIDPVFNPSNPDEFYSYAAKRSDEGGSFARKINICTGEEVVLFDEVSLGIPIQQPSWWGNHLVFTSSQNKLWIVNENGEKNDISNGNKFDYATWCMDGKLIMARAIFPHLIPSQWNVLITDQGEIIDTFHFGVRNLAGRGEKVATYSAIFDSVGYIDLNTQSFTGIYPREFTTSNLVYQLIWLDDENIAWVDKNGIYSVNIETKALKIIKVTDCDNLKYESISVSPADKNVLLLTRSERTIIGIDTFYIKNRVSMLNIQTGEEKILDLEE